MNGSVLSILFLGFFLGLKHAVEADHLAAVTTIVSDRKSLWASALVGGVWGLGHTISLSAVAILVLLLDFQISDGLATKLEMSVGIMLVLLGLNMVRKLVRGGELHFHAHEHGGMAHVHPHVHGPHETDADSSHHGLSFSPRALVIGMVHGLAGSAALMLLVIPTIQSRALGFLYIVIFGVGSIGGMMIMSFLLGLPLRLTAARFGRINFLLKCGAATFSVLLGFWIIYVQAFFNVAPS